MKEVGLGDDAIINFHGNTNIVSFIFKNYYIRALNDHRE